MATLPHITGEFEEAFQVGYNQSIVIEPIPKPVFVIDGDLISDFADFTRQFTATVLGGVNWTGNLDAFNDYFRGGFGTPEGGFVLRITNSAKLRLALGYPETIRRLQRLLMTCHPSNRDIISKRISQAELHQGATLFDEIVQIIRDHGPGGTEAEDGVELVLD